MPQTEIDRLDQILEKYHEGCLRASVADSLKRGWQDRLAAPHRNGPKNTTVSADGVPYGNEPGWFTLIREDGHYKAGFWTAELRHKHNIARKTIDIIQESLSAVLPPERMMVRGAPPFEWLAMKGMSLADIARIRR